MPVDKETILHIACDNPDCPGNTLDPTDRLGWTFISSEVYGEPTAQNVFCCPDCAGAISQSLKDQAEAKPPEPPPPSE